jgi:hypothetical protein
MHNRVVLERWYAQPIHCPFCGAALEPNEEVACKHLLYIISGGNFVLRSDRFNQTLEIDVGEFGPEFSLKEKARFGSPESAAAGVLGMLPNGVEYEIVAPTDSAFVGFAAFEEELCGWGIDHQSPYSKD